MTKAVLPKEDYAGRVHRPGDYDSASVPPWVQETWWQEGSGGASDRAYWASLDIQLAYPSIRLPDLLDALVDLIGKSCTVASESHRTFCNSTSRASCLTEYWTVIRKR